MVGISNGGWYALSYKLGGARFMVWDTKENSSPAGVLPSNFPVNDWVNIVCVRNVEKDSLEIYINGSLLDKTLDKSVNEIANDGDLFIGAAPNWPDKHLRGAVDEIQMYNKALTAEEIKAISDGYGFPDILAPVLSNDSTLSDLQYNGTTVTGFSPTTLVYNVELPEGTTDLPKVTATTNDVKAKATVTDVTQLPGKATVLVEAEDGSDNTYEINFTVKVGINNLSFNRRSIFFDNQANELIISEPGKLDMIRIYDIQGKLIINATELNKTLSVNDLNNGIYFVKAIYSDNSVETLKIVK